MPQKKWKTHSGDDTNGWWIIVDEDGNELGSCDGGFEEEEAVLMAAAPELLESNENLLRVIGNLGVTGTLSPEDLVHIKNAAKIIKKATI